MIKTSKIGTAIHLAKGMMEEGTPFKFWVGKEGEYLFDDIPQQRLIVDVEEATHREYLER